MALFNLEWKKSVFSDIKKISKPLRIKIIKNVEALQKNPFPSNCKKLTDTEKTFRIRVSDYRVIYQVDPKNKLITIELIAHRKDVYRRR